MVSLDSVASRQTQPPQQGGTPGDRVRRERLRRGWSQEDLAVKAGCHRNTIANIERNDSRSRRTVEDVATALDTTPAALGFTFPKTIRMQDLTEAQRDVVDRVLSLPPDRLEAVKAALVAVEKKGRR